MAFDAISLEPFSEIPAELRTEAFFRTNEFVNAYVEACSRDLVRSLETSSAVARDRLPAWQWLVARSHEARLDPAMSSARLREAALEEIPSLRPAFDLIDAARAGYPSFLRGERTGSSILFDPAVPGLWDDFFSNQNPVYRAGNVLAAHTALAACRRKNLRVVEVGAGAGSGAEALLDRLGPAIGTYRLTDISPGFLRKARDRIDTMCHDHPQWSITTSYQLLDLNKPATTWPLAAGSCDLVYGVNVLHAVRDLDHTLRSLRSLLVTGGLLILGECVRPARGFPVHPEFIFQLLDEFRDVVLDPERRPNPGFLDETSWRASFSHAGFSAVHFVPDFAAAVKAYPAHSLAALVARKD